MPASGGSIHHSTACSGVVPRLHCLLHIADYIILQQGQDQFIIVLITVIKKTKCSLYMILLKSTLGQEVIITKHKQISHCWALDLQTSSYR